MRAQLVQSVVSILVVAHFAAIAIAVTSYSSPNFPAPQLAVRASRFVQPYLQATFLNNAYRFFAPNPGTPSVFWFRIQYDDRSVHWVELPGRSDELWRAPYQRRLNLALQLGQSLAFVPGPAEQKTLAPMGKLLLESAVRHVARTYSRRVEGESQLGVRSVGVYCVFHSAISPAQVRAGWGRTDLRTYRPTFVGAYTPEGERIDEFRPAVIDQPISYVAAGILQADVLPSLARRSGVEPADIVSQFSLPEPIAHLVKRHPELLAATAADDLERRIEALVVRDAAER